MSDGIRRPRIFRALIFPARHKRRNSHGEISSRGISAHRNFLARNLRAPNFSRGILAAKIFVRVVRVAKIGGAILSQ
jgi:hypothetical protein